jgi:hypothetical protein
MTAHMTATNERTAQEFEKAGAALPDIFGTFVPGGSGNWTYEFFSTQTSSSVRGGAVS